MLVLSTFATAAHAAGSPAAVPVANPARDRRNNGRRQASYGCEGHDLEEEDQWL